VFRKFLTLFFIFPALISCSGAILNVSRCGPDRLNTPDADAPNVVENIFGEPIQWSQNSFPIDVVIDSDMRSETRDIMIEAIEAWNRIVGLKVFTHQSGSQTSEEGTIWVTQEPLLPNECDRQLFGLASRFYSYILGIRSSIHHSTIRMHTDVPSRRILSTAIHELGHALGLQHDREISSIMYPFNLRARGGITEEDRLYVRNMASRGLNSHQSSLVI